MRYQKLTFVALFIGAAACSGSRASQSTGLQDPGQSVVMIRSVRQDIDYVMPWKREHMTQGSGSGLIVADNKVLTNAHNV
ncbi:MAG: hypothetical protein P8Z79_04810, partial [Sedimentisphaerales bacterium]